MWIKPTVNKHRFQWLALQDIHSKFAFIFLADGSSPTYAVCSFGFMEVYHFKECLLSTEIEGIKRTYIPFQIFFDAVFYFPLCI